MPRFDDEQLHDIEAQLHREDPHFAEALGAGRPRRPREYRHGRAWLVLTVSLTVLGAGIAVGNGLLIAGGLVMAGAAGPLFEPQRTPARGRRDK